MLVCAPHYCVPECAHLLRGQRSCVTAEAEQPEDWDTEEDGEWEAPQVPNPKCTDAPGCGEWQRPQKPNPEYKGKWSAPMIDNPEYKVRAACAPLCAGLRLLAGGAQQLPARTRGGFSPGCCRRHPVARAATEATCSVCVSQVSPPKSMFWQAARDFQDVLLIASYQTREPAAGAC